MNDHLERLRQLAAENGTTLPASGDMSRIHSSDSRRSSTGWIRSSR